MVAAGWWRHHWPRARRWRSRRRRPRVALDTVAADLPACSALLSPLAGGGGTTVHGLSGGGAHASAAGGAHAPASCRLLLVASDRGASAFAGGRRPLACARLLQRHHFTRKLRMLRGGFMSRVPTQPKDGFMFRFVAR